eukprot:TRINITY_DN4764_c0_g1_i1.p1 TRINITY_DN4764_c0_g1~~TRINITY_DN4764_c0_g1_i1.p1  ORF type:complete len:206 (-),score=27.47 TRINITY_DN4764_c0_g1_i1:40-657(-)
MFTFNSPSQPNILPPIMDSGCFSNSVNRTLEDSSLSLLHSAESWSVRAKKSYSSDIGLSSPGIVGSPGLTHLGTTSNDIAELYASPSYRSCIKRSLVRQVLYSTIYVEDRPQHIYHISIANDNVKPIKSLLLEITPTISSSNGVSHTWGMEKLSTQKTQKRARTSSSSLFNKLLQDTDAEHFKDSILTPHVSQHQPSLANATSTF